VLTWDFPRFSRAKPAQLSVQLGPILAASTSAVLITLWPRPPALNLQGDHVTRRRRLPVRPVLPRQPLQRPVSLLPALHHPSVAIHPNPPEQRPVLVVVVNQERAGRVGPQVLQSPERKGGLGFGVDGRVDGVAVEDEAAGDDVREAFGGDGGDVGPPVEPLPADRSSGHPSGRRRTAGLGCSPLWPRGRLRRLDLACGSSAATVSTAKRRKPSPGGSLEPETKAEARQDHHFKASARWHPALMSSAESSPLAAATTRH